MKNMNTIFSIFVSTFFIEYYVKSCDFSPGCQDKLHARIFYDHHSDKQDSSMKLIKAACDNWEKFNKPHEKMVISFHIVAKVENVDNDGAKCKEDENCDDEVKQACAESVSGDAVKFRCCTKSYNECVSEQKLNTADIDKCVNGGSKSEGYKILRKNSDLFSAAKIDRGDLPVVVFNDGEYSKCTDNNVYDDFVAGSCELFKPEQAPRPPCFTVEL